MVNPKERRKAQTKEHIKKAALKIADKEGWEKVSIRKIADLVNYTPPIVYEFFKDKNDLYHQLVIDGFTRLSKTTLNNIEEVKSIEDKVVAVAKSRLLFAQKYDTLHYLMFDADNPEWQKIEIFNYMGEVKKIIKTLFIEITQDEKNVDSYILNFVSLVTGFVFLQRHMGKMDHQATANFINLQEPFESAYEKSIRRFIDSIKIKS